MQNLIQKSLAVALREALPLRIVYEGKEGITERVIIIKKIEDDCVVAYCRMKRRMRSFKLDNILAAEIVRKP